MANAEKINCQQREVKTKGYLNQLKRSGFVPGTVYGKGLNQAITLDMRQLSRVFQSHGSRGLFSLQIDGNNKAVMAVVREIQKNPISGQLIHVDFWQVNMDEQINNTVSIYIIGEEELVKNGGILQVGIKEIEVSCLPQDIPESLACDVATLKIGDKITVGDLSVPGVEILSEPDSVIVTVLDPSRAGTGIEPEDGEVAEAGETGQAKGE